MLPARNSSALAGVALAVALGALAAVQFSTPDLFDGDSYFHVRYASVVREAGLRGYPPAFPWLPLTILAPDRFADHHMLYHLLLVPFTFGDRRLGGKLAALAGASAFVIAYLWFLRRRGVREVGLALLVLGASSIDVLFRLEMTRVQALSLVCLLVGFDCALTRRHGALAAVACLYAWLYDGFPLLLVPVGAVMSARLLIDHRVDARPAIAALAGMAIGLIANPYFPHDLVFLVHHIGDKVVGSEVAVGGEWRPYGGAIFLLNAVPCLLYLAFGALALVDAGARRDESRLAILFVALVFAALTLRAQRFIEYLAPMAAIFIVVTSAGEIARFGRRRRVALVAVLGIVTIANVTDLSRIMARRHLERPDDRFAVAARHVARTAPPGAMLCSTDWGDFPLLYFDDVASTYLVGLDPTYLSDRSPEAYRQWSEVARGAVEVPSRVLGGPLPCAWVVSDRGHAGFLAAAAHDQGLRQVIATPRTVLYEVVRNGTPALP
jgi:hypothetical protein